MLRFLFKLIFIAFIFNLIVIATLFFLPAQYYKDGISWLVKQQTGGSLQINGDLRVKPFEPEFFVTTDTVLSMPLEGGGNLTMDYNSLSFKRDGVHVPEIVMQGAEVTYQDPLIKDVYSLSDLNLGVYMPTPDSALTVKGDAIAKGERVNIDLVVEDPKQLQEGGKTPVKAKASASFFALDYVGSHSKQQKDGNVKLNVASIAQMTQWLQNQQSISGKAALDMDFVARGNSIADLEAKGKLALRDIVNPQISEGFKRVMAVMVTNDRAQIDSVDATFNLQNGVLKNDDLVGVTPVGKFTGKGMVDLVAQTIDYRIEPDLSKGPVRGLESLTWPVSIKGPIAAPEVNLEAQAVIEQIIQKDVLKQVLERDNAEQTLDDAATAILEGKAGIKLNEQDKKELQQLRDNLFGEDGKKSLNKLFKND